MRLADFILAKTGSILNEWDAFAKTIWPGAAPSPQDIRDHAEGILRATARDMMSPQTSVEQRDKSRGLKDAAAVGGRLHAASEEHATDRAASGFDIRAVIAEYRALRASVVRLWLESIPVPHTEDLDDLTRFHESMDQSLAQAVHRYSDSLEKSRQVFLAVLGHDLRTPLNAITFAASDLIEMREGDPKAAEIGSQIQSSALAAGRIMNDILDFATCRLGRPIPVNPAPMDLAVLCREVVDEMRSACPGFHCHVTSSGDLRGEWDQNRLRQLLSNLVGNAAQYGAPDSAVVSASADGARVVVTVHNAGTPIPEELLPKVFDPMVSGARRRSTGAGFGLGLYIAREVALAHGGDICVTSTKDAGTTFIVSLPRRSRPLT